MVGYSKVWFSNAFHDDVIKWKHFTCYWPFVRGIHRSPVNCLHKGQWRGALLFSDLRWINSWVNNHDPGDLRHHRADYDVAVMMQNCTMGTRCETAASWMPKKLINEKSILLQLLAWCCRPSSHYLSQCWLRCTLPYGITIIQDLKWREISSDLGSCFE